MTDTEQRKMRTFAFVEEVSHWPMGNRIAAAIVLLSEVAAMAGIPERDFFDFVLKEIEAAQANQDMVH